MSEIIRLTRVHISIYNILDKMCYTSNQIKPDRYMVCIIVHIDTSCDHLKSHDTSSQTHWSWLVSYCPLLPLISWDNICPDQIAGGGGDFTGAQYITLASSPKDQQVCMHVNSDRCVACVWQRCLFMTNLVHFGSSSNKLSSHIFIVHLYSVMPHVCLRIIQSLDRCGVV